MQRLLALFLLTMAFGCAQAQVQPLVNFQFTLNPTGWEGGPVSGWINVQGDPSQSVITVTDPVSHITISSVSTLNWYSADGACAEDRAGDSVGPTYFPPLIMIDHWYQTSTGSQAQYNALLPQLQLSGLNKDSSYILRMSASDGYSWDATTAVTQYTVAGRSVYPSQTLNTYNNTTQGVTFLHVYPDSNGVIRIYVNTTSSSEDAQIAGLQVLPGSANVGSPTVAFTKPTNGTVLPEGTNLIINATASESGASITKVEFYADTVKIAEVDNAPYTFTWVDPDPGSYVLTAKATDNVGTVNSASINIAVDPLNYFWSTTGNAATGGDSNFVGTVDSNRLSFRTKNIERMTISALGNVGIGTDSPTAKLHTLGTVRLAGLKSDSANSQPRMLVADTSGNLYYRSLSSGGLNPGDGLGQTSTGISLGDSIPGPGPHSFNSNRYQYLNGYNYSIGGTVRDPLNHPAFRIYNNGDLVASTTMDRSVNTELQTGLRYYSKLNILQIGASDRLDTTRSVTWWPGGGILVNSYDYGDPNVFKGYIRDSYVQGNTIYLDSPATLAMCVVTGQNHVIRGGYNDGDIFSGYGNDIEATIENSIVSGAGNLINKPSSTVLDVSGFANVTADTARGSIVGGANNQFGGMWQMVAGLHLINRTPAGTTLGSGNVDFSALSYTGLRGLAVPGIENYPLFALGNSDEEDGSVRSNALTVLYNGRTQINTTGHTTTLTQDNVTPKAALDVVSTNTGVLLPRLTTAQRNAITSGDLHNGLLLYNTDSSVFQFYNGSTWTSVGSGSGGSGRWSFSGGTQYDTVNNIGIGTNNTQGYKLAVNGTAIFTKIKVKPVANWPDYVFKKAYTLPSLPELERYINEHRHLPGIASEKEVQATGIDVSEHEAALLKKVEELTLYLIEQNRRLDAQQKEIDALKALILEKNKQH